ncbi:MAG: prepilin-type N-terminal cleavage/methylation domain-containing protein [Candidatus Hydrogenedentes bacterium]|nr:prepilin-type N-terminal cleavage/methylation domain-containing protein [Candidatus Hydrogenedentota bacterium]
MDSRGFTLMELMMTVAILFVVSVLGILALQSSSSAMAIAASKSEVEGNVRDVLTAMAREIELSSKTPDDSLLPPLEAVAVNQDPAPLCPVELSFQIPLDDTGLRWSSAIRYRFYNEDVNGDGLLNPGEDVDGDRSLSRRILRLQDRNNDGDASDPDEQRPLAGANNLTGADFAINANVISITLSSEKLMDGRRDHPITTNASSDIYLQN